MKLRHFAIPLLLPTALALMLSLTALGDGYFYGTNTFNAPGTFTIQSGVALQGTWAFAAGSTLDVTNANKIGFPSGGGGTPPAGSNGQVQWFNNGVFGASPNLTWDNTNNVLGAPTFDAAEISAGAGPTGIGYGFTGENGTGIVGTNDAPIDFQISNQPTVAIYSDSIRMDSNAKIGWSVRSNWHAYPAPDTYFSRNAAGVVQIVNDLLVRNVNITGTCTGCGTGGGGGNVSNFGTPTANQKAVWVDATHIQGIADNGLQWDGGATSLVAATGRASLGLVIGTNVEAWDADLDAIAALTGTNVIYYRSAAGVWNPVTIGGGLSFTSGKLDNAGVASFNSRTGAVVPAANDYSFGQLSGSASATQMPAYTGDVTSPAGSTVNTIGAGAVTYAKIQNVTAGSFLGRGSASGGPPQELNDGGGLYIAGTVVNAKSLWNASTSTQTSSGSEVYLTGSMLTVAGGDFVIGATYHAVIQVSKTAAGTNAATYTLRCGTGGGTGDAAIIVGNLGTQSAVADTGMVDLYYTFTAIGASANVIGTGNILHNISNGLFPTAGGTITVGSVATGTAFASGSATKIGVSWNAGLGAVHTLLVLRAELTRP